MQKNVVIYFSGYGHTQKIAEHIAIGADAYLIRINENGDISQSEWNILDNAKSIILGSPTYMGGISWQFKKFADNSSKKWAEGKWKDKIFGGFTISASLNGDKQVTLIYLQTLAFQHQGIWVSLGMPPSNTTKSTREDINSLGSSIGMFAQCPSDAGTDFIPKGDIITAEEYGKRIAYIADKLSS
ncbi:TPA: flavodoxin family protein [Proteus mirabilis]